MTPPADPSDVVGRPDPAVPSFAQERRVRAVCAAHEHGRTPSGKTIGLVCALPTQADVPALEEAVRAFIGRHPVLRHRFVHRDGDVSLRRVGPAPVPCTVAERELPADIDGVERFVRPLVDRPFEVLGWPLLRFGVVQGDRPVLYLSMDHLVIDGWSITMAMSELEALYQSILSGRPAQLLPPGDFLAFSAGQRRRFASGPALDREVARFHRLLAGRPAHPPFPVDARPWDVAAGRYVRLDLLEAAAAAAFARRCRTERGTVFMGVLAAFGTAIWMSTGRHEAGMLVALHNRATPEEQNSIGWYANMLPLYFPVASVERFGDTLRAVRTGFMALLEHAELPLARVLDSAPDGHYSGVAEQYPTCFVSFSDDRTTSPGQRADGWTRISMAPAYRVGYGLWVSLNDEGLQAVVASPQTPAGESALVAFEATLAGVLRRIAEAQ
jgi:hypothetical protein